LIPELAGEDSVVENAIVVVEESAVQIIQLKHDPVNNVALFKTGFGSYSDTNRN